MNTIKVAIIPFLLALVAISARADQTGEVFKDCSACPDMIIVPPGSFHMGSPADEKNRGDDEQPIRKVNIGYSFAVGVYEVTFDQWQACLDANGCDDYRPDDSGWGRGDRPVINVSWLDAKNYVAWLSEHTGKQYRLLTESEWEYVARAGTQTLFWWGDQSAKTRAVCAGCDAENRQTKPVGTYKPNPFGLFDVHGNAWEWVEDCWSQDYSGHPTDGSAWQADQPCKRRVNRGGSWANGSRHLRSANRSWKPPVHRGTENRGFRVAMSLGDANVPKP